MSQTTQRNDFGSWTFKIKFSTIQKSDAQFEGVSPEVSTTGITLIHSSSQTSIKQDIDTKTLGLWFLIRIGNLKLKNVKNKETNPAVAAKGTFQVKLYYGSPLTSQSPTVYKLKTDFDIPQRVYNADHLNWHVSKNAATGSKTDELLVRLDKAKFSCLRLFVTKDQLLEHLSDEPWIQDAWANIRQPLSRSSSLSKLPIPNSPSTLPRQNHTSPRPSLSKSNQTDVQSTDSTSKTASPRPLSRQNSSTKFNVPATPSKEKASSSTGKTSPLPKSPKKVVDEDAMKGDESPVALKSSTISESEMTKDDESTTEDEATHEQLAVEELKRRRAEETKKILEEEKRMQVEREKKRKEAQKAKQDDKGKKGENDKKQKENSKENAKKKTEDKKEKKQTDKSKKRKRDEDEEEGKDQDEEEDEEENEEPKSKKSKKSEQEKQDKKKEAEKEKEKEKAKKKKEEQEKEKTKKRKEEEEKKKQEEKVRKEEEKQKEIEKKKEEDKANKKKEDEKKEAEKNEKSKKSPIKKKEEERITQKEKAKSPLKKKDEEKKEEKKEGKSPVKNKEEIKEKVKGTSTKSKKKSSDEDDKSEEEELQQDDKKIHEEKMQEDDEGSETTIESDEEKPKKKPPLVVEKKQVPEITVDSDSESEQVNTKKDTTKSPSKTQPTTTSPGKTVVKPLTQDVVSNFFNTGKKSPEKKSVSKPKSSQVAAETIVLSSEDEEVEKKDNKKEKERKEKEKKEKERKEKEKKEKEKKEKQKKEKEKKSKSVLKSKEVSSDKEEVVDEEDDGEILLSGDEDTIISESPSKTKNDKQITKPAAKEFKAEPKLAPAANKTKSKAIEEDDDETNDEMEEDEPVQKLKNNKQAATKKSEKKSKDEDKESDEEETNGEMEEDQPAQKLKNKQAQKNKKKSKDEDKESDEEDDEEDAEVDTEEGSEDEEEEDDDDYTEDEGKGKKASSKSKKKKAKDSDDEDDDEDDDDEDEEDDDNGAEEAEEAEEEIEVPKRKRRQPRRVGGKRKRDDDEEAISDIEYEKPEVQVDLLSCNTPEKIKNFGETLIRKPAQLLESLEVEAPEELVQVTKANNRRGVKKKAYRAPPPPPMPILAPNGTALPPIDLLNSSMDPDALPPEADMEEDDGTIYNEDALIYSNYRPKKVEMHCEHPANVVESATLGSAALPDSDYEPDLPSPCTDYGNDSKMSSLQLETVKYVGYRHSLNLPTGERAGFFCGDGTGVGKGRQIAGVIADNFIKGRRKSIWFTASKALEQDAIRDLKDIGCNSKEIKIPVFTLPPKATEKISAKAGCLFCPYTMLVSGSGKATRYSQILSWCGTGFEGVIVFDEGHMAKNLKGDPEREGAKNTSSKTAKTVDALQRALPKARVVYVSATGASEPRHMSYMSRLGLWGPGTAFTSADDFQRKISDAGVAAMEMVAMEMKSEGMYCSRHLSFEGVEFQVEEHKLTDDEKLVYNQCAELWRGITQNYFDAIIKCNYDRQSSRKLNGLIWSASQRFFLGMCLSLKAGDCIKMVKKAIQEGYAVVIGLFSTGESAMGEDEIEEADTIFSASQNVAAQILEKWFPIADQPTQQVIPELKEIRDRLLKQLSDIDLPSNPLDQLIDELGGVNKVAELTGRTRRLIRNKAGTYNEGIRKPKEDNPKERDAFQDGKKLVAIISEAASIGISLQADRSCKNKKRRMHIVLQLPWAADKAVQQLGRTHRSNQVCAPLYRFLITELGGEWRLASTVAARLCSLGALTNADRRAGAGSRDLSKFLIKPNFGKHALDKLKGELQRDAQEKAMADTKAMADGKFIKLDESDSMWGRSCRSKLFEFKQQGEAAIKTWLNRLLSMGVEDQKYLFGRFSELYELRIKEARKEGTFDEGVYDIEGELQHDPVTVYTDPKNVKRTTKKYVFSCDRGISWEKAKEILEKTVADSTANRAGRQPQHGWYVNKVSGQIVLGLHLSSGAFHVAKPNIGHDRTPKGYFEFTRNYRRVNEKEAEEMWQDKYESTDKEGIGNRIVKQTILVGSVLFIFKELLENLQASAQGKSDGKIQIVRAVHNSEKMVGIRVPQQRVVQVCEALLKQEIKRYLHCREEILTDLLRENNIVWPDSDVSSVKSLVGIIPSCSDYLSGRDLGDDVCDILGPNSQRNKRRKVREDKGSKKGKEKADEDDNLSNVKVMDMKTVMDDIAAWCSGYTQRAADMKQELEKQGLICPQNLPHSYRSYLDSGLGVNAKSVIAAESVRQKEEEARAQYEREKMLRRNEFLAIIPKTSEWVRVLENPLVQTWIDTGIGGVDARELMRMIIKDKEEEQAKARAAQAPIMSMGAGRGIYDQLDPMARMGGGRGRVQIPPSVNVLKNMARSYQRK
eukprot:TRINITY_DN1480_c0_g3_i1.p1 TRINITY_DN1480_c0_g3~~TRINITY_DN1480_c0_g3_i1.p1  ORF type:complete len:2352 (-),score=735.05 TRINITY_DN1480_c0_g3_i1:187-7242(-)